MPPSNIQASQEPSAHERKPKIIGIYGISGSGKSTLLEDLKQQRMAQSYVFYESCGLGEAVPDGLGAFDAVNPSDQQHRLEKAMDRIQNTARQSHKSAIVTGSFTMS